MEFISSVPAGTDTRVSSTYLLAMIWVVGIGERGEGTGIVSRLR